MGSEVEIRGRVDEGFGKVADAFEANFTEHGDVGAAFALYVDGEPRVDIWGGTADVTTGRPWAEDTLQLVFSSTKGPAAMCVALLNQRGDLDYEAPVARYWPEFAANGKEAVTVAHVMSHTAGLAAVDEKLTRDQIIAGRPVVEALERQKPLWEPGTAVGYHALTYGWLVGEIIRRVDGRDIGTFVAEELSGPLGMDFWIGAPEEVFPRIAPLIDQPPPASAEEMELMMAVLGPGTMGYRALTMDGAMLVEGGGFGTAFNDPAIWAAQMPAANGITDARSLARAYASCLTEVDGTRLLEPETLARVTEVRSEGPDLTLAITSRFGLGFMLHEEQFMPMFGPGSFGHAGAGGSLGYGDTDAGIGFGYVMNQMTASLTGDPRTEGLTEAVRACLG